MAAPTFVAQTSPAEGGGGVEQLTFTWDFRASSGPSLESPISVTVLWQPLDRPPVNQDGIRVVRAGPTAVSQPGQAPRAAEDITTLASVTVPRRFHQGNVSVTISWTPKVDTPEVTGAQTLTSVQPVGDQVNAPQVKVQASSPPQITALLRSALRPDEATQITTQTTPPTDATRFAFNGKLVEDAVNYIHGRLRAGLGPLWGTFGPECLAPNGAGALSDVAEGSLADLTRTQLEECWAQLITEMAAGAAYHGPGSFLDADEAKPTQANKGFAKIHRKDSNFFISVRTRAQQGDLVFSCNFACQQLSTMIVMSRSANFFTLADDPFDCGAPIPDGALTGKGQFIGALPSISMKTAAKNGWLAPGVSFFRDPAIRHVATLIRAFQSERAQMIDTGGWNTAFSPFNLASNGGKQPGISLDTIAFTNLINALPGPPKPDPTKPPPPPPPPRGPAILGVAIPPPVADSDLLAAIKLLKKSRSIGFVRLVISLRNKVPANQIPGDGAILWVSRRLHMHEQEGDTFLHYPQLRLLNALRGCPHSDLLDCRWQIFVPFKQPALDNAFSNGRTVRWWEPSGGPAGPPNLSRPVLELSVSSGGIPQISQRDMQGVPKPSTFARSLDQLEELSDPSGLRKQFPEIALVDNSLLPRYFQKTK